MPISIALAALDGSNCRRGTRIHRGAPPCVRLLTRLADQPFIAWRFTLARGACLPRVRQPARLRTLLGNVRKRRARTLPMSGGSTSAIAKASSPTPYEEGLGKEAVLARKGGHAPRSPLRCASARIVEICRHDRRL